MDFVDKMLAYLNGYVPEKKLETLRKTAQTNGWALLVEDVKEDDTNVPTLLNIPKKFSMAQQIFDFIGILPGYFETDVSIALFIFLGVPLNALLIIGSILFLVWINHPSWLPSSESMATKVALITAYITFTPVQLSAFMRRMNDAAMTKWLALILAFPIVGNVLATALGIIFPSNYGVERYY